MEKQILHTKQRNNKGNKGAKILFWTKVKCMIFRATVISKIKGKFERTFENLLQILSRSIQLDLASVLFAQTKLSRFIAFQTTERTFLPIKNYVRIPKLLRYFMHCNSNFFRLPLFNDVSIIPDSWGVFRVKTSISQSRHDFSSAEIRAYTQCVLPYNAFSWPKWVTRWCDYI